jgi:small GTP-binding protein
MEQETFDCQYSVLLIGNSNSGKTSLLTKYVHGRFSSAFNSTIGIDFKIKSLKIMDKKVKLRIWDSAGQDKFRTITSSYYKGAQGVMICYAVDNRESFHGIKNWLSQTKQLANDGVITVLVGCKSDVHPREVSPEEAERLASEHSCTYYETSSQLGTNVDLIFTDVVEKMHNKATRQASGKVTDEIRKATVERNKFLQSAYEVKISGAQSWYNKNKINGRYVPQITKDGQILLELGRFCYWNIDSPNTVMVYKDSHWVIRRNRKELAKVASSSIQCFPDTASLRNSWFENRGVYFSWMYPQPQIKCSVLNTTTETSDRISVADIFAEQRGTIDMNMFLQYSREPEQMGLTIPLFVRCCQIKIAILDLEYRSLKRSFDYVTMAEVRIQRQQIDKACKALLDTVSLPEQPPVPKTKDGICAALAAFLDELNVHYEQLTDVENGNFDAARRCRDTQQELIEQLDKLQNFVPGPDASRLSMMVLENMDLRESDLNHMHMRVSEGGTMLPSRMTGRAGSAGAQGGTDNGANASGAALQEVAEEASRPAEDTTG